MGIQTKHAGRNSLSDRLLFLMIFLILLPKISVSQSSFLASNSQPDSNVTLIGRWVSGECNAICVAGNYAYIAKGYAFDILDISNPAAPTTVGQLVLPDLILDIFISDNYAYVTTYDRFVRILDVTIPTSPREVGFLRTAARKIFVSGNFGYAASGDSGLQIIDFSHQVSPVKVGFVSTGDVTYDVCISGNYAYIATELPDCE